MIKFQVFAVHVLQADVWVHSIEGFPDVRLPCRKLPLPSVEVASRFVDLCYFDSMNEYAMPVGIRFC